MAYLVGMLANSLPVPGGFLAVEGGLVGMLLLFGVRPASVVIAAVIVYRAISLWMPALIGSLAFLSLRREIGKPVAPPVQRLSGRLIAGEPFGEGRAVAARRLARPRRAAFPSRAATLAAARAREAGAVDGGRQVAEEEPGAFTGEQPVGGRRARGRRCRRRRRSRRCRCRSRSSGLRRRRSRARRARAMLRCGPSALLECRR